MDDDVLVANTTARVFSVEGYDARAVYSAEEAFTVIREWRPAAAIIELVLPKLDGLSFAKLMQLVCPDCVIVLISTQDLPANTVPVAGRNLPLFFKPVHPSRLVAAVTESLYPIKRHRLA